MHDHSGARRVSIDDLPKALDLSRAVPRNVGEVRVVVATVILERTEQLQVEGVPKPKLNRGRPIGSVVEIWKDRLSICALGRCGEAEKDVWLNRGDELMKAVGGEPMAFVHNDSLPIIGAEPLDELPRGD